MPDADQKFDHSFNSASFSDVVTHQPIPAVPIPPPPPTPRLLQSIFLPCQSRGGSLAIFTWPVSWAFANPVATSQLLILMWFPFQI